MSGRRVPPTDVLGEVRRAMRILRRVERFLKQEERDDKRRGAKAAERFERQRKANGAGDGMLPL